MLGFVFTLYAVVIGFSALSDATPPVKDNCKTASTGPFQAEKNLCQNQRNIQTKSKDKSAADFWIPECDDKGNFKTAQKKGPKNVQFCVDPTFGCSAQTQPVPEAGKPIFCDCVLQLQHFGMPSNAGTFQYKNCEKNGYFKKYQNIMGTGWCMGPKGETDKAQIQPKTPSDCNNAKF